MRSDVVARSAARIGSSNRLAARPSAIGKLPREGLVPGFDAPGLSRIRQPLQCNGQRAFASFALRFCCDKAAPEAEAFLIGFNRQVEPTCFVVASPTPFSPRQRHGRTGVVRARDMGRPRVRQGGLALLRRRFQKSLKSQRFGLVAGVRDGCRRR